MRVLITGATGFLGSHLCHRMVRDGHDVRILHRATSDCSSVANLAIDRVVGDVTNLSDVQHAIGGCDAVVHAAANLNYWSKDTKGQRRVNVDGTKIVAQTCREMNVRRVVHVSSVAAIGIPTNPTHPATEEYPFNLANSGLAYHLSKWEAEKVVLNEIACGLNAVIVNPASIFGPYTTTYRLAEMLNKVNQARVVPYFTGGLCAVHVDDVVEGIIGALDRGQVGQRYILGGENLTYQALVERVATAKDLPRRFIPIPPVITKFASIVLESLGKVTNRRPRISYATHYCGSRFHYYNSSKARNVLGFQPRDFKAILDECLQLGVC